MEILQPAGWPRPAGYANGVSASGRIVAVAGQLGWDPRTGTFETDDFIGQLRQALSNIAAVLHEGGAEPGHVARLTWYITDRDAYRSRAQEVGEAYREVFGRHFPAMTVIVVAALLEPRALLEIEATAIVPA